MAKSINRWMRSIAVALAIATGAMGQDAPTAARAEEGRAAAIVANTISMDVLDNSRRLGPGDRISYRVVEERRAPVMLVVADGGDVEVPLIGRVPASGQTCRQLASAIKPILQREYFHRATVIIGLDMVSPKARGRVYISGQVRQQGPIEIPPDERFTLSKAILKAGGFADFANKRKIKLIRKGPGGVSQTTTVDIEAVTVRGQLDKDPELQADDTIVVPEKFVNF